MLRLLADENFNGDIVRGLHLRNADIDLVRAQDSGLQGASDPEILEWCANNGRILLTFDRKTMPEHIKQRFRESKPACGVFIVNDRDPAGRVIEELLLLAECTDLSEWQGTTVYLPLHSPER